MHENQSLRPHQRLQKEAEPWALDQETGLTQSSYGESAVGLLTKAPEKKSNSFEMAMEALAMSYRSKSESASDLDCSTKDRIDI